MRVVLSALFWLYLAVSLALWWFAVVIPWLVLLPFDRRRVFSQWYAYTWARHYNWLSPFWHIDVHGRDKVRRGRAYVLVANHRSLGDIFVLFALRKHFKWVSKASVFKVPFLGWMMWMANYIGLVRNDTASRRTMMDECRRQLDEGSSIMMFPEGTRSKTASMRPFKLGAFRLACDTGVPVIPLVVVGSSDVLPRDTWVFDRINLHHVQLFVLDPVDPAAADRDPAKLAELVRTRMEAQLAAAAEDHAHVATL
ncbi:MAG: 1-acyl-sn-glycerol-3-phosphate acyltransferase [Myxococcales bacterium FL481]|nr:MAG: 1-acyl-sn-glycerol-3-phosphate acyltransferase [Myxococcales bacterium FL481]